MRGKMFDHLVHLDNLIKNIIEAKRRKGKPRRAYMDQIRKGVRLTSEDI